MPALGPHFLHRVVAVVAVGRCRRRDSVSKPSRWRSHMATSSVSGSVGCIAHVDDAGLVVDVEDLLPGLAAVGGLEQAALLVGAVEPAEGADVDDVRVLRDE